MRDELARVGRAYGTQCPKKSEPMAQECQSPEGEVPTNVLSSRHIDDEPALRLDDVLQQRRRAGVTHGARGVPQGVRWRRLRRLPASANPSRVLAHVAHSRRAAAERVRSRIRRRRMSPVGHSNLCVLPVPGRATSGHCMSNGTDRCCLRAARPGSRERTSTCQGEVQASAARPFRRWCMPTQSGVRHGRPHALDRFVPHVRNRASACPTTVLPRHVACGARRQLRQRWSRTSGP